MAMVHEQLAKVMAEVGAVGKSKRNAQQGYQFRGIDDVVAHVQEVMAKHGVIVVPRVIEREREMVATKSGGSMASVRLLVQHTFFAADGSSVVADTLGEAMDSGDKASNKAMSAALKYALTETLLIPTYELDRDTEEQSPELARVPQTEKQMTATMRASLAQQQVSEVDKILAAIRESQDKKTLDALTSRIKLLSPAEQQGLRSAWGQRRDELKAAAK